MSTDQLAVVRDCLASTPLCNLLGMTLLRQGSPQLLPSNIPREVLREAVTEIIAYTGRCVAAANRLSNLAPVPLLHVTIVEFGL